MEERVTRVLELDRRVRELIPELEGLAAERNRAAEAIAAAKRAGQDAAREIEEQRRLRERERALSVERGTLEEQRQEALLGLPNLPLDDVPEREELVVREVGEAGRSGRDHLELAGAMIDMDAAARISGSRFAYLRGELVFVELALVRWALERLRGHGFEAVIPPVLVREPALYGTGFLPDTEQQIYRLADDELYLIGTSEVPLASLRAGEILDEDALPLRYAGFSPCFRREAGAAGKDTRGIFRVHQFDKVEMFVFTRPEDSAEEHERLLAIEEALLQELEIPYRVVNIPAWDLGASAAKKYDCEAWLPGQGRYRELTSCSNTTDFQARRLDVRLRRSGGGRPIAAHTLNGTAVAVGRTIIALLENGQQADGSVRLPSALVDYGAPAELAAATSE